MKNPSVTIGILIFRGEKFFDHLLASIAGQKFQDFEILVLDNEPGGDGRRALQERLQVVWAGLAGKVKILRTPKSLSFSRGHNLLLERSRGEFYFCANQDLIFCPGCLHALVQAMVENEKAATCQGAIFKWDFAKGRKLPVIDSLGLRILPSFKVENVGEGLPENFQKTKSVQKILGPTGAAFLARRRIFQEHFAGRLFDENFPFFKEDCDLAANLTWGNFPSLLVGDAVCHHARTAGRKSFFAKSEFEKINSNLGQSIFVAKHFHPNFPWQMRWKIFWREFFRQLFLAVFAPRIFWKVRCALQSRRAKIAQSRRGILRRIPPKEFASRLL